MNDPTRSPRIAIVVANCRRKWIASDLLRLALAQEGCEADITDDYDLENVMRRVAGGSPAPQVLLVDLLTGEPGAWEENGLLVIETARRRERATVGDHERTTLIVALWQAGREHPELDRKARVVGADLVIEFASLVTPSGGIGQLADEIRGWLIQHGIIDAGPRLELPAHPGPGLQTALSDVGRQTIRLLLADLAAKTHVITAAELAYVTPGASGAHVLRAKLTVSDGTRYWLLKLSRNRESLETELSKSLSLFGSYRGLMVHYLPNGPAGQDGWFAIATEFADEASTLRHWLCEPGAAARVPGLLNSLFFDDGLVSNYGEPRLLSPSADTLFAMKDFRRARVARTVDELRELLGDPRGAAISDVDGVFKVIEAFAREGRIGGISTGQRRGSALGIVQHGDLHGGNILVTGRDVPQPCMIDLASHGLHHWAYDLARLVVDIVMHCVDLTPECHFWERWASWRHTLKVMSGFGDVPDDAGNPGATAAMRWVVEHHARLLPHLDDDSRWQWHVAIAEQLLRAACRALPTPKRVLGLAGAYDQLELAAAAIGDPPETF